MIKAVIYVRYSSRAQRDASIEQQLDVCRRYAATNDLEIVGIYEDRALTGTNDNRPGFQQMIADSEKGDWQIVLVYALDRFARNRYDSAIYKRQLKVNGVKVLSATEAIADDPTGIIVESLFEGMSEYYSAELSRKIRRGMDDNAKKFMTLGAVPLGYRRGPDGRYQIIESEAAIVREIFDRVTREPIADIIRDLNERGVLTKYGKPWSKSSFGKILSNDRYIGVYTYKGQKTPDAIPAIISHEQFANVQDYLGNKPQARKVPGALQRRRMENGTYLLTGKAFCGECGEPLTGKSGHGRSGAMHYYYQCRGKTAHVCENKAIRRDDLERTVAAYLNALVLDDDVVAAIADSTVEYQQNLAGASDLKILKEKQKEIDTALQNIMRAIEMGIFNNTTKARMEELEEQKSRIGYQIDAITSRLGTLMTRAEIIAAIELFREGDIEDKKYQEALIDAFLVSVHVYADHYKIIATVGGQQRAIETGLISAPSDSPDPSEPAQTVRISSADLHQRGIKQTLFLQRWLCCNGLAIIPSQKKTVFQSRKAAFFR